MLHDRLHYMHKSINYLQRSLKIDDRKLVPLSLVCLVLVADHDITRLRRLQGIH